MEKLSTSKVLAALRKRFDSRAYAILTEVGNATGFRCARHCDALVMSIWPSRGLELIGIEIKTSRTDWLKERDNPAKADAICRFCDRWYLAVGDARIVRNGELPPTWGLMLPYREGMTVKVEAPKLHPEPITRDFLAAIFRRAVEQSADASALKEQFEAGRKEGLASAELSAKYELERLRKLKKELEEFESASGLQIEHGWQGGKEIGDVVRRALTGEFDAHENQLKALRKRAASILESIDRQLEGA